MVIKPNDWTVDYFTANESECVQILENSDALQEIPSLNGASLDSFRNGQLVRFQGMIQDMYNPEYYLKYYQVTDKKTGENTTRCGMYIDLAQCEPHEEVLINSEINESAQRDTWIVISVPGLNDWAKENCSTIIDKSTECMEPSTSKIDSQKRPLNEIEEPMDCSEPLIKKGKVSHNNANTSESIKDSEPIRIVSKEHILNFPIPNKDGKACIVKIYKEYSYKLNEVIDIVGFLSLDPNLSEIHNDESMEDLEKHTHYPPASMVPRLHAINIVKETNKHIPDPSSIFLKAERIQGDLRIVLSQILFGDEIAADYLICHLISSVYLRKNLLCLGAFSLNITNFPKEYTNFTKDLYDILKQIIMKSHYLDITLENLNDMNLIPKKDYDCDRLTSGILQLSKNTHLIIDETGLTAGQVTPCGTQNYATFKDLIEFQKLNYDFKFYSMEYETDIPVLILSETKSFIPCHTQVALRPDPETVKIYPQILNAAKQYLKDEMRLHNFRQYVNALKNAQFEFSEEMTDIIQEDFIRLRQSDNTFSADNMHCLMVLSRLMSLSTGSNLLKPEMWKRAVAMEMERISRLPKRK